MATVVNIHEAKTHLSKLLARVSAGEEIVIARAGKPVARITPIRDRQVEREPGFLKDKIWMAPDFDAPLPAEMIEEFYKGDLFPR